MRGARMLKSVSRSLSDVGRRPGQSGLFKRRPLYRPPITRINHEVHEGREGLETQTWLWPLTNFNQSKLILPALLHELQELARQAAGVHERARFPMRRFHHVAVAHEIAGSQLRQPRLPGAEEVARPAQLEIALGDHESIARLRHRLQ